jgi:hypothetical protein
MPETLIQKPKPSHASILLDSAKASFNRVVRLIPPKGRAALLTGLIVLIGLAVYTSLTGSATLNLICRHALRSADISVSIDGKMIYADHISASPKKFYEILGKRSETFSKSLTVPSGNRVVEVHLSSATDGFDQTRQCELSVPPGKEATLLVETQQGGMSLVNKGSATVPARNLESGYSDSLRSVLVTLLGSGVSAAIGFFVQEFLRSKKTAQAVEFDQHL